MATVQFLASLVRNYFGDGSDLGVSLAYSVEESPLGTAGSVLAASDLLSGPFIVISGDALTDLDLRAVVAYHRERGASATMVLKHMPDPLEFGIVMTGDDGQVERFLEKPTWGQVFSDTINTGIYVLEPEVLDLIPVDQPYDFSSELFPAMLDKGLPIFGYVTDAYWTDVGNSEAYIQANHDVLSGDVKVRIPGFEYRERVWVGEDVEIDPTARIEGPALIGDNSRIGAGARVGKFAVVGSNVILGPNSSVAHGVVMDQAEVASYAQVRGGVLGRLATLEQGATLEEAAVVGDEVVVGAGALVQPRLKIYPGRSVEAGAIVTQSVVRERKARRNLFGSRGVSGRVNVGLTPLAAVRLGMAYGTTLKRGSVVVTGRDASRAARTMKRAVIAGLNSAGVTCHDLELVPLPLTRFTVASEQAAGGVSVRTSPGEPETVEIRLLDADGADLGEAAQRKIERVFFREDYRRPAPMRLGELEFPPRALQQYATGLVSQVDVESIRRAGLKIVVDYAYGPYSAIGPAVLGRLGCDVLALNAYTDEQRPALGADELAEMLSELADHVKNSGSNLGVLIEPGGDVIHIVDDRGRIVSQERALLAFVRHEARAGAQRIALPVSTSIAAEALAKSEGAIVQWTPTSVPALMARAGSPDVAFAGNSEGTLMWPAFMAAPDGLMTLGKLLELTAREGQISDVVDSLPEVHVTVRDVQTPWSAKGAVMRYVATAAPPGQLTLLDGVKVVEAPGRWALVIPYSDEPICRVWAEGRTDEEAREIADRYARLVEEAVVAP